MRKLYFVTIALVCFSFLSNAQIRKGSVYLGGDLGYSSQKEERLNPTPGGTNNESEQKGVSFSPSIGVAVKENVFAGIDLSYSNTKGENLGTTNYKNKVLGAGVFLRRYFPVANKFYLFGQIRLGYYDREYDQNYNFNADRTLEKGWGIQAGLYPGLSYNIYKSLYLEMGLNNLLQAGYESLDITRTSGFGNTSSSERKSFSIGSSLSNSSLTVGLRFILPKK
jgi:hypothetical protein